MMIVLMMATLFHQSSIAWHNGLRQAQMSIQARSAMSLMRRDLSQAVAGSEYKCNFDSGSFSVYVLGTTTGDVRTVRQVSYSGSIDRNSVIYDPGNGNYFGSGSSKSGTLLENVDKFVVTPAPGWSSTNLPEWVDITITLSKQSIGSAGIKVCSYGRDHIPDTEDDKGKRLRTWK